MAQNTANVYNLLDQLLEAYTPTAKDEYAAVQALAREEQGDSFTLMPWDWSYYSQKLKDRKFNLNDEMLRPYFELEHVKEGVFGWPPPLRHHLQEESRHTRLPQGRGGLRRV